MELLMQNIGNFMFFFIKWNIYFFQSLLFIFTEI